MKHIIDQKLEKPNQVIDTKLVSQVFVRFNSIWPGCIERRWSSPKLIEAAKIEWGIGLSEFAPELIENGLILAQKTHDKWPPTLPEFINLVKQAQPKDIYKKLPKPPRSRKLADSYIQKMKEKLNESPKGN